MLAKLFFSYRWPQYVDELLTDMSLPAMRSGGNWFNWIFKVIQLSEIEHLAEERAALRRLT
jgi:dimethylaniline monooxygenase (N-oxide forming)